MLQEYVEPPLAVKTTLPPEQKVVAPPVVIVAIYACIVLDTIQEQEVVLKVAAWLHTRVGCSGCVPLTSQAQLVVLKVAVS